MGKIQRKGDNTLNPNNYKLNMYFEKDIIEFLDKQAKKTIKDYKDNTTEFKEALKQHNHKLAIELIKKLTNEYNQLSKKDIYKELTLNKINEIIKIAKYYLDKTTWTNQLGETITQLEKELNQNTTPQKILLFEQSEKLLEDKEKEKLRKEYIIKDELDKKFEELQTQLFINIRKKELKKSIETYRELKKTFDEYPGRFEEEKQDKYNDILASYVQIKKLKEELKDKDTENFDIQIKKEETHNLKIEYINQAIEKVKELTRQQQYDQATRIIIELKNKISKIPESYKRLKTLLNSKIDILTQRLEMSKRLNKIKEGQQANE